VKAAWIDLHRELASRIGARHEIISDAGHHIQRSRPDRIVAAIRAIRR
jgi:pimeloyl-ACP methyl ester carboxylesterase